MTSWVRIMTRAPQQHPGRPLLGRSELPLGGAGRAGFAGRAGRSGGRRGGGRVKGPRE
ncbi:hypothetical protein PW035_53230 [Nonomuraea angiospora]|nr:hypothetical protein [Nonomuraea angiospora]